MKILGNILFIIGIILSVSMSFGQGRNSVTGEPNTTAQKIQMWALAAIFLAIGARLSWGKKKPKDIDKK